MLRSSFIAPLAALCALLLASRAASADGEGTEGAVVAVETDDVVTDLGAARGAEGGDLVEIWRPLHVRHPVTGKALTERFLIGRLRLVQVRPTLSLAVPEGTLSRTAQPGDIIVLPRVTPPAPAIPAAAPASRPPPSPPPPVAPTPEQLEDSALCLMFDSLHEADVIKRIRAYEDFATAHPRGRRSAFLLEEARALRTLLTLSEQREAPESKRPPVTADMQLPRKIVAHEPLRLAIEVHGSVVGVVLHVRQKGADTYESQPMARSGPVGTGEPAGGETEYWAAIVPAESIAPPGLRYFVEAVDARGTFAVIGTAEAPEQAEVLDVLPREPRKALGQASLSTDYASFNARAANDYIWQTEGTMGVRFGDTGIRAVRTGFGVYRGEGGTVYDLDTLHLPPVSVGLTYGYLETELGFTKYVSIGLRATVGLDNSGLQGGGFGFLRIGSDLGTNLWFGAEGLGGIGVRGITQFEWNAFPRWPLVLRTEVTNEPAGGDVGVRAIAQVGYRVLPHFVVSVRGSYQGRTIDHSGPGGGAAVAYAW